MLTTFIRIRRLTRFKHTHKCPAVGQPSSVDIIMTSGDACPTARPEKETFALPSIGLFFKTLPFDDALTDAPFHAQLYIYSIHSFGFLASSRFNQILFASLLHMPHFVFIFFMAYSTSSSLIFFFQ